MKRTITINESYEARGKRSSVIVRGEPLGHTFDERKLGEGPARALADAIRKQIAEITEQAKASTIAKRESARRALAKGAQWAVERYGAKPPIAGSRKLFTDSGRLLELLVRAAGDAWQILAPPDRLDGKAFAGGELEQMVQRLRELVPALRAPLEQREVRAEIERTVPQIIRRGRAR